MEKIISEFKVIETDEGFRIELKGDKEAIRRMINFMDPTSFFSGKGPSGQRFRFDFGPDFWADFSGRCGPWWEKDKTKRA